MCAKSHLDHIPITETIAYTGHHSSEWVPIPGILVPFRAELCRLSPVLWVMVKSINWYIHYRPFGNKHTINFHILFTDSVKSNTNWV